MEKVNEKSTFDVEITFYDKDGTLVTPVSGTYRIDDLYSATNIKPSASFVPISSTHTITVSSSENAIVDSNKFSEIRVITISYNYNASDVGTSEIRYELINLTYYS